LTGAIIVSASAIDAPNGLSRGDQLALKEKKAAADTATNAKKRGRQQLAPAAKLNGKR